MTDGLVKLGAFKNNALGWKAFRLTFTRAIPHHKVTLK